MLKDQEAGTLSLPLHELLKEPHRSAHHHTQVASSYPSELHTKIAHTSQRKHPFVSPPIACEWPPLHYLERCPELLRTSSDATQLPRNQSLPDPNLGRLLYLASPFAFSFLVHAINFSCFRVIKYKKLKIYY